MVKVAEDALSALNRRAAITADQLQQPTILKTDERLKSAIETANVMIAANIPLTMDDYPLATVDADLVAQWITVNDEAQATLDETALGSWVDQLVQANNTVGSARTYTRADGKQITVKGGVYGWEIDRDALLAAVKEGVSTGSTQRSPYLRSRTEKHSRAPACRTGANDTWTSTCPSSMRASTMSRVLLFGSPISSRAFPTGRTTPPTACTG